MFWIGYRDRKKKAKQEANLSVIDNAIERIGRPLGPDDIRAIAELARALNGDREKLPNNEKHEIDLQSTDQSGSRKTSGGLGWPQKGRLGDEMS
jgi:hypothetical protein